MNLARKRRLTRLSLWFERLWLALWPAVGALGAYAAAALLGLPDLLPPWPRLALLAAVAAAAAWLAWRGLRRLRAPDADGVDRRLERVSGLRHRPLAALEDRPAAPTPEADALWRAHIARLSGQVARLRVGLPHPGLASHDIRALRGGLVVALAAGLFVAGPDAGRRLLRAVAPGIPAGPPAPVPQVQAWVTPPAYTGLPPVFLRADAPDVSVPAGSRLTIGVTGGGGEPQLLLGGTGEAFRVLDAASWQAELDLTRGGALEVRRRGAALAAWTLTLIPDHPPVAAFPEPPGPAVAAGRPTLLTRLPWRVEDDYGVAALQAELRLRDRPDAAPAILPAPLPAGLPKAGRGALTQDLTAHPWAGLPVTARLVARDAPGGTGASADMDFVLPERAFTHPTAQAVIALRKQLSVDPASRPQARTGLAALAEAPEAFDHSVGILLNLRSIAALLARGRSAGAVDEAQLRMWELALALEENTVERTARALEAAREAVREALEAQARDERDTQDAERDQATPDPATPDPSTPEERAETDRRIAELQEAIRKHMEALAEQARRDDAEQRAEAPSEPTTREMERKAEEMRDAAREDRTDDARERMAELERMLEQLEAGRPEMGERQRAERAEKRQQGQRQQSALQDMVKREGGLLDSAQGRAEPGRTEPGRGEMGFGPRRPPPQPPAAPSPADEAQRDAEARTQRALRRALGELMQRFGDLTGQVPAALGEADTAMRDAGQALQEGRDAAAGSAQRRAIEALQRGGREMSQQIARQFGPPSGEGEGEGEEGSEQAEGEGDGRNPGNNPGQDRGAGPRLPDGTQPGRRRAAQRDPLGRPMQQGVSGSEEGDDVRVPEAMEQARTRALQEELRRRGGERGRPQPELDYIDRLLKAF